jgi:hypothetical protein
MLSIYFAIVCVGIMLIGLLGSAHTHNSAMRAIYKLMMFAGSAGCVFCIVLALVLLV